VLALIALTLTTSVLGAPVVGAAQELPRLTSCAGCYKPRATTSPWQIQFQGRIDTSVRARFFDIDGDEEARTVRALQRRHRKVACYINAGAWEDSEPTRAPSRLNAREGVRGIPGGALAGHPPDRSAGADPARPQRRVPGEGLRRRGSRQPQRLENDTGFPLTATDQLGFNTWLANEAHARELSIGLKNDGPQAGTLAPYFDWVIVEECIEQRDCGEYAPFTRAGKPIFEIEYRKPTRRTCAEARRRRISVAFKTPALRAPRKTCTADGWRSRFARDAAAMTRAAHELLLCANRSSPLRSQRECCSSRIATAVDRRSPAPTTSHF
jgi:hypothetical protein